MVEREREGEQQQRHADDDDGRTIQTGRANTGIHIQLCFFPSSYFPYKCVSDVINASQRNQT